ncbi:MalY/PatB family protein [Flagellimonas sp.]|uniref:MalY/PatB family protein n=1 Tax=Flagellimonas sp. TaxID=2058762 RepID=UPI003B5CE78A
MDIFDKLPENYQHKFARTNPHMLKNMFGATDLAPFWIADMEFPIAEPISQEIKRIADRGIYAYEFDAHNVFASIVDWNKKRNDLVLDQKNFVQVTGVLTGIAVLIRELTQAGDGILIQTPVFHQFAQLIKSAGRKIVSNPLKIVDGAYKMDVDDMEEKLQSGAVKMILLCNPHNPVGRVWTKDELKKISDLATKYGVPLVSDEIHSDIIFEGHKFQSIVSIDPENHIALLGSPAKTFGMQSISNGYLYIPNETLRKKIKAVVGSMHLNHGNAVTTFATIAAFKHGAEWLDGLIAYLQSTINWIDQFLAAELPTVKMSRWKERIKYGSILGKLASPKRNWTVF